jgi:hypothetical protein
MTAPKKKPKAAQPERPETQVSELERLAAEAMRAHAQLARNDPLEFNAFVLKDENTGQPVTNAPAHIGMHDAIDCANRVLILAHIESGKTSSVTVGRTLFELSHNPDMTGAIVSAKEELAQKPLATIKTIIAQSPEYRMVFPEIEPGGVWQANKFSVERPNKTIRDPTMIALGMNTEFLGARLDWVVCDDLLTLRNTRTAFQRNEVVDWFRAYVLGRVRRNGKIILVNTAWHEEDLIHRLARQKMWYLRRFPVGRRDPLSGKIESNWPEAWPAERIASKADELGGLESREAKKQLWVEPVVEDDVAFSEEGLKRCQERGVGCSPACATLEDVHQAMLIAKPRSPGALTEVPTIAEIQIVHGLDLGGRRNAAAGKTVLTTLALHPDGSRQIVNIHAARIGGPAIRDLIIETFAALGGMFMIENNSTQQWILEFTREVAVVPMIPFTTGSNKADPKFGIESLEIEFQQGGWIIPCTRVGDGYAVEEDIACVLDGLRDFDPNAHTSDYVMSLWFARECARRLGSRARQQGNVSVTVVGRKALGEGPAGARSSRSQVRRARENDDFVLDVPARWRS